MYLKLNVRWIKRYNIRQQYKVVAYAANSTAVKFVFHVSRVLHSAVHMDNGNIPGTDSCC